MTTLELKNKIKNISDNCQMLYKGNIVEIDYHASHESLLLVVDKSDGEEMNQIYLETHEISFEGNGILVKCPGGEFSLWCYKVTRTEADLSKF